MTRQQNARKFLNLNKIICWSWKFVLYPVTYYKITMHYQILVVSATMPTKSDLLVDQTSPLYLQWKHIHLCIVSRLRMQQKATLESQNSNLGWWPNNKAGNKVMIVPRVYLPFFWTKSKCGKEWKYSCWEESICFMTTLLQSWLNPSETS